MNEIKTIEVTAYRDANGKPTCAKNFLTGEVCMFYRTSRYGCNETCLFAEHQGRHLAMTHRRGGDGTLIPQDCCPLWKKEELE